LKPIRSSLLLLLAAVAFLPLAGCGGGSDPDPQQLLDTALSRQALLRPEPGPADVEVASLGFEDAVLDRRILRIDAGTNRTIREALAGAAGGEGGLSDLLGGLAYAGEGEVDGVPVEKVTGSIDVDGLVEAVRPLASSTGDPGSGEVPGLGDLEQLSQSLVAAGFELSASSDDGRMQRFDLILSLDDPGNSLPPSRIRFALADPGASQAGTDQDGTDQTGTGGAPE
jgi:hypothetical protein